MTKADHALSTSASGLNRRGLLVGGAALAGAASVAGPGSAHALTPSPELVAWRRAREVYLRADQARDDIANSRGVELEKPLDLRTIRKVFFNDNDPAMKKANEVIVAALKKVDATVEALIKRPVRTYQDVAELKEVLCGERSWMKGQESYEEDISCPELDALFAAIDTMAGGPHG